MACNSLGIYSSILLPASSSSSSSKATSKSALPKPAKLLRSSNDLANKMSSLHGGYMVASDNSQQQQQLIMGQLIGGGMMMANQAAADAATKTRYDDEMRLILEAVADRIEMHENIGKQRDNWNTLLLNSINAITLTATTMAGLFDHQVGGSPLKLSSTLLFGAATTLLLVMNKIQPSQLAEEQRNATRLFKQLNRDIQSIITPTEADVKETTDRLLALDRAYPLPLLGDKMLQKFPNKFHPAKWWPVINKNNNKKPAAATPPSPSKFRAPHNNTNGWSNDLEEEMRAIVGLLKTKDEDDYLRLGNIALKVNKVLAISGPLLTALATAASAFPSSSSSSSVAASLAVTAGALAAAVNTFEHGGQVGMVVEMYRNCAGFFCLLSESIESTLDEKDWERRENGDLFQRRVALKLGRSLSDLKNLASSATSQEEFASKLF